jgi:hypothetical protein
VINFRYHIVSLTAVFLALAIGLIVGTAAGNGPAVDVLEDTVAELRAENQGYREQRDHLKEQYSKQEQYARETAPLLLAGKLPGRRVLILSIEDSDDAVDDFVKGTEEMLDIAGANVVGKIKIRENFTQRSNKDRLSDLAATAAPSAVSGALPSNGNAVETSAALLATLTVGRSGPLVEGTRTVLAAYESQDFIDVDGELTAPAEAVVIVAGQPYSDAKEKAYRNGAALTIVARFDQAGPVVLSAGSGAGDGNVVRAVRDDPALAKSVSTVDTAATPSGRVCAVLALVEQVNGRVGHYGLSPGATTLIPKPANGS